MNKLTVKLLITWLMVYGLAAAGPVLKKYDSSLFSMYELVGIILIPIIYILFGMYIQTCYAGRVKSQNKLKFVLCSWISIFTGAALQFLSFIAFSPGVPKEVSTDLVNILYILMALFAVFSVLTKRQIQDRNSELSE